MTDTNKRILYSATTTNLILGLPVYCNDPIPQVEDGEVVIYYGGWALKELRDSPGGKVRMCQDATQAFDIKSWTAEPGYYRISRHGPDSNRKRFRDEAQAMRPMPKLHWSWQHPPVGIAATALLVHLIQTGADLLDHEWLRCVEAFPGGGHVGLYVSGHRGLVCVGGGWDDFRYDDLWMVAPLKG